MRWDEYFRKRSNSFSGCLLPFATWFEGSLKISEPARMASQYKKVTKQQTAAAPGPPVRLHRRIAGIPVRMKIACFKLFRLPLRAA